MRQKQSPWISLVLYCLVMLSLFLTWRILIVPANPVGVRGLNPTSQTPAATNALNIEDLFAPHQMSVHSNSNTYVTQNPRVIQKVHQFLSGWGMRDVALTATYSEEEYEAFIMETGRIELRFQSQVYLGLLTHYFNSLPEDLFNQRISRILISTDPSMPIYLVNDQTRNVYTAQRPESNMQPLITLWTENQTMFHSADAYAFREGIAFLPRNEFDVRQLVYLVEKQPNSFFINQLFEDTTELRDDSNEYVTAYSDNISELRINKETGILSYYRNSLDQTTIPSYQQVRDSFHSLKFIETWTHASYFSGFQDRNNEVTYRRFVEGYPIFSFEDRGTVRMEMSDNYLIRMQYPTEVIQTPLTDREEVVTIPRAQEVIDLLVANGYTFSQIDTMQLGYEWESSEESSRIAELEPKWFVKMDGAWRTVDDWLTAIKGDDQVGF